LALKDQRLQLLFGQYVQAIDNVQRDFLETDQVEIQRKLRRFCSRQNQQVIQQARQSIDFFQSASDGIRMANCVSAVLQRILAQPPDDCQRGTQFVRRVGWKPFHPIERILEPFERFVEYARKTAT
jgi:hypothetical protein